MKRLDLMSSVVAAGVGALLLLLLASWLDQANPQRASGAYTLLGALVGFGVQTTVRLTGVS